MAEVTGEDLSDITSRGFSLARRSLEDEAFDCVAHEPSVLDWDLPQPEPTSLSRLVAECY